MTNADTEVVEGELLPDVIEHGRAAGLFGSDDPKLVVVKAVDVPTTRPRHPRQEARRSAAEHVLVGGWTLLGLDARRLPGPRLDTQARGRLGGARRGANARRARRRRRRERVYPLREEVGEGRRLRDPRMAQTRATSKALRMPLGFVMELAGFDATAGRRDAGRRDRASRRPRRARSRRRRAPPRRRRRRSPTSYACSQARPRHRLAGRCVEIIGVPWKLMTGGATVGLIDQLQKEFDRLADEDGEAA